MSTFAELYCARHRCPPEDFPRRIFWRTLHWRSLPLVPLLWLSDHFAPDHKLIEMCARARRMREVSADIREHASDLANAGWLRRCGKVRLSTRRLRRLAARYLTPQADR